MVKMFQEMERIPQGENPEGKPGSALPKRPIRYSIFILGV